jgi:hypothetical protein
MKFAAFATFVSLHLDVVVSVRRQNNQLIMDEVATRTAKKESHVAAALEDLVSSVEADSTDALLSLDAVEVCGPPLQRHLAAFDAPCPKGRLEGGPIAIITSGIGQDQGPFMLPDRLYVCNPNSKLKGALFKHGESPKAITTSKQLESTVQKLFAEKLFKWVESWPNGTSHRRNGEVRQEEGSPPKRMLWVLDMDGNWIVGPETQEGGLVVKHGDFTPGEYPWKRPKASRAHVELFQGMPPQVTPSPEEMLQEEMPDQDGKLLQLEDENSTVPKVTPSPAETTQDGKLLQLEDESSTLPKVPKEKRVGGNYRGLARAGGEIRFYPEKGSSPDLALIEDSSSSAFWRANVTGLDPHREMNVSEVEEHVQSGTRDPPMAMCAMRRLKEYLTGPVGLSLSGAKIQARIVDPKTQADFYVDP